MIETYGIRIRVNSLPVFSPVFVASKGAVETIKKILQHNVVKVDGKILWGTGLLLTPDNDPKILYGTLSDDERNLINEFISGYLQIDIYEINEIELTTIITENLL